MPPRPSRIAEAAAERGLSYQGGKLREATFPGRNAPPPYARRQLDVLRDEPAPFTISDDAVTAKIWMRTQVREGRAVEPGDVLSSAELRAIITVLRHDGLQQREQRTEREARQFAWALRRLHGKRRVEWTRYRRRGPQ